MGKGQNTILRKLGVSLPSYRPDWSVSLESSTSLFLKLLTALQKGAAFNLCADYSYVCLADINFAPNVQTSHKRVPDG
eukprot:5508894-Amphidinium_carterae.1